MWIEKKHFIENIQLDSLLNMWIKKKIIVKKVEYLKPYEVYRQIVGHIVYNLKNIVQCSSQIMTGE